MPNCDPLRGCTNLERHIRCKRDIRFSTTSQQLVVFLPVGVKTVSYNTARSICDKLETTGNFQTGARGRPDCKMQPFMAAYLEAMVLVNPFFVSRRNARQADDLSEFITKRSPVDARNFSNSSRA